MEIDFYAMEQHAMNLMTLCANRLAQILDSCSGDKLDIELCFSVDPSINAKSTVCSGKYTVTLNVGAYVAISQFYEENLLGSNVSYYQKITGEPEYNREIADYYFKLMRDISLLAFIYHECGHIYSGHLDYIAANKSTTDPNTEHFSLSADDVSYLTVAPIRHQAMEWNADDFSATRLIETIFSAQYWKEAGLPHQLSFLQLFWVAANAILVSYCLLGSKKADKELMNSAHLPAKFRALSFIHKAEKKLQKWCGNNDITPTMIDAAIAAAKEKAEVYGTNYKAVLSAEEKAYFVLVEYELLVKLPVALFPFQHLQCITPELMLHTMVRLYDSLTAEEQSLFQEKLRLDGRPFSIDSLKELAKNIVE